MRNIVASFSFFCIDLISFEFILAFVLTLIYICFNQIIDYIVEIKVLCSLLKQFGW